MCNIFDHLYSHAGFAAELASHSRSGLYGWSPCSEDVDIDFDVAIGVGVVFVYKLVEC